MEFWNIFKAECKYLIIEEEICPDTNRKHWKIFLNLKNKSLSALQKLMI